MSEIATAIGDLKLKAAEVWPTVQVVSQLHCTYAELAPALVLQLKKVFEPILLVQPFISTLSHRPSTHDRLEAPTHIIKQMYFNLAAKRHQ